MFIAPKSGSIFLAHPFCFQHSWHLGTRQTARGNHHRPLHKHLRNEKPNRSSETGVRSAEIPDVPEEPPEDEFAPAAVEMDVSQESPLLQVLYKATRETKEKEVLARLDEAKALIQVGHGFEGHRSAGPHRAALGRLRF